METSDSENRIRKILEGFKKNDELHSSFRNYFIKEIFQIIEKEFPDAVFGTKLTDYLFLYADNVISSTESVIDKDFNYPEFRKEEEVNRMKKVVEKLPTNEKAQEFTKKVHSEAKKSIVKFYPLIYELSGSGFRLLELNAKFFNHGFINNFYSLDELKSRKH
jgi:hypothetical protein